MWVIPERAGIGANKAVIERFAGFDRFLGQAQEKFGAPASQQADPKGDGSRILSAVWQDDLTVMTAEDRRWNRNAAQTSATTMNSSSSLLSSVSTARSISSERS